MERKYYRAKMTGKIFTDTDVSILNYTYGENAVNYAIKEGFLEEIEPPSVIDLIISGQKARASRRYMEIHGIDSLRKAYDAVNHMETEYRHRHKKK